MIVHCFFEQSGTFKNEFNALGVDAYDYDILDNFGETDYKIDLYKEIENGYCGKPSIFDDIVEDDLIMAFFPCVRFENQIMLSFRGQLHGMENWDYRRKMENCMKLLEELKENYDLVNKLFIICIDRGLKLIMENPYSEEHFLRRYWCYKPAVIDKDRRINGDYFKKPTQFWFLNIEPKNNFLFEPITHVDSMQIAKVSGRTHGAANTTEARSMIHSQYANRFIRQYIL